MSCKDCGNKASRHQVRGDVDSPQAPEGPPDPFMDFMASRSMTYEQLKDMQRIQQNMMKTQQDYMLGEMTEAMKRKFIEDLVGVANSQTNFPGTSPSQAVVTLKEALEREDFRFILGIYPNMKPAVDRRYAEIVAAAIPLN